MSRMGRILTLLSITVLTMGSSQVCLAQSFYESLRDGAKTASDKAVNSASEAVTNAQESAKGVGNRARVLAEETASSASQKAIDITGVAASGVEEFTRQISVIIPKLELLGYEIVSFRVKLGLPPKAKLTMRAKASDVDAQPPIVTDSADGALGSYIISTAVFAKRMQNLMGMGSTVMTVDFALPPKVKITYLKRRDVDLMSLASKFEDMDLLCGQGLD